MNRESIFFLAENDPNTYDYDEELPSLPLPELHDTMQRYYESVRPFATAEELVETHKIISQFEHGVGAQLHEVLKKRAANMKNWLGEWWDAYGYHMLRLPLNPYTTMASPIQLELYGIPETSAMMLKNLARITYHTIEFWDLLRKAQIKPLSSNGGKIKYSSALFKRFFSTTRVPGEQIDHIEKHFRTVVEGATPTHGLILGKGRLFIFDCVQANRGIITPQQLYVVLERVRSRLDYEPSGSCVAVLTHDNRTTWANNRQQLQELSPANKDTLKLIESAVITVAFDEHEPKDYDEVVQLSINGDFHTKWGDRSSTIVAYKSGRFSCVGEHSAYDGTISVSYLNFTQLSMFEGPEPDWSEAERSALVGLKEVFFDLNDHLRAEIQRMLEQSDRVRNEVLVTHSTFDHYGKDFIKTYKLHPDSFVQVIMQLTYTRMHKTKAPTYETALMRHYYNGRTETLRSCTNGVNRFIDIATDRFSCKAEIVKAFRDAVESHNYMMNEARKGHGIDRHLFGLWCAAYENKMDIPDFYSDPLYSKSGGGGNFVLSTSTLGYTPVVGFVAPMVVDGYGVFYAINPQSISIEITAYRDSSTTSGRKFVENFKIQFRWIKSLLEEVQKSKL